MGNVSLKSDNKYFNPVKRMIRNGFFCLSKQTRQKIGWKPAGKSSRK